MTERLKKELELLAHDYPGVRLENDGTWLIVPDFPVPAGWNRETITILVIVPAGYPQTPPDNFHVEPGLKLANGEMPDNYTENCGPPTPGWSRFSWHIDGTWRPSSNAAEGDNLHRFLWSVRGRLGMGK